MNEEELKKLQDDLQAANDRIKDLSAQNEDLKGAKQHAFDSYHELKKRLDDIQKADEDKKTADLEEKGSLKELVEDLRAKLQERDDKVIKMQQDWDTKELDVLSKELAGKLPIDEKNRRFIARDIRERLTKQNGQVGVLGRDGKLTANNLDDLVKEINTSDDYAHLIIDRMSQGSGAIGNNNSGAGVTKRFGEMSSAEKAELYSKSPEKYEQAKAADSKA